MEGTADATFGYLAERAARYPIVNRRNQMHKGSYINSRERRRTAAPTVPKGYP